MTYLSYLLRENRRQFAFPLGFHRQFFSFAYYASLTSIISANWKTKQKTAIRRETRCRSSYIYFAIMDGRQCHRTNNTVTPCQKKRAICFFMFTYIQINIKRANCFTVYTLRMGWHPPLPQLEASAFSEVYLFHIFYNTPHSIVTDVRSIIEYMRDKPHWMRLLQVEAEGGVSPSAGYTVKQFALFILICMLKFT